MGVDFVPSNEVKPGDGQHRSQYDIEYTTPLNDTDQPTQAKSKSSFFGRFHKAAPAKKTTNQSVVHAATPTAEVTATPAAVVTPTLVVSASPAADKAYAIVEHQEGAAPVKPIDKQVQSTPKQSMPVAPVIAKSTHATQSEKKLHIIPPPPPPPSHHTPQVPVPNIQATSVVKKNIPPLQSAPVVSKPTLPPPVAKPSVSAPPPVVKPSLPPLTGAPVTGAPSLTPATAPKLTVKPSHPSAPAQQAVSGAPRKSTPLSQPSPHESNGDGSAIIAQNVSGLKGEMTQPPATLAGGLNVNLLPQYGVHGLNGETGALRLLRVFTMTVWGLSLVYALMVGYQAYYIFRNEQIQQELTQLNGQIESYQSLQTTLATTNATLSGIQELLNEHVYWTNWFTFLEHYTLPNVYYTEFSGNSGGSISLSAVTDTYESVTQQINAFRSASTMVESVEVNTATRSNAPVEDTTATDAATTTDTATTEAVQAPDGLIHFSMTIKLKPELFYYHPGQYDTANATN